MQFARLALLLAPWAVLCVGERQLDTVPAGSKDSVHWNAAVSRLFADARAVAAERALKR